MPVGFTRSLFGNVVEATPSVTDRGYWQGTGSTASGANGANIILDRGASWGWYGQSTLSFWFRGSTSDMDSYANICQFRLGDDFAINCNLYKGTNINNLNCYTLNTSNPDTLNNIDTGVTDFDYYYLNNQWHHCVFSFDSTTTTYTKQCYLDGVQIVNTTVSNKRAVVNGTISRYMNVGAGPLNSPGGSYENDPDGAHLLKIANFFYTPSYIDLGTNISKFYNGGFVSLGTNGTASGLPQPQIYVYSLDSGNMSAGPGLLQNGGSVNLSLIKVVREGTGNIFVSTTGGPGING